MGDSFGSDLTRITRDRLRAYQGAIQDEGLAPYTVATRIQQIGNALRAIAPGSDCGWMLTASSRLRSKAIPMRDKRVGMQPAADVERLAYDMMHAAEHDRFRGKVKRAVRFRDGLMLAMLVTRPLRRANITSVEIGSQLRRHGEHWRLCFGEDGMKSDRHFECSVPERLTTSLNRYIGFYRSILLQCTRKALTPTNPMDFSAERARHLRPSFAGR